MTPLEKGMIYELRIYDAMPGRLPALLSRFENHTLQIWEKHGIRQAGFWTTLIGANESNRLTYLLAWNSMTEREERWSAFLTDPEWIAIKAETEKDGQLVQNISSELLAATAFSSVGGVRELESVASGMQTPLHRHN
ncbi:NIPSNAP family protein [Nostoc sp. FACHB-892]|uniref:NIPSNAP family protein n=1 Tax=Nostoc sp. FACHB-892 TaxID=2692843 RepID=UPI0018EF6134|nr:NIPSNAP family protein [Nostoc sp. FACHB-892]